MRPVLGFCNRHGAWRAQNYTPMDAVLAWSGLVAAPQLVGLLEAGFWPQWHAILGHWLSGAPDHDEVARWYLTWKGRFPQVCAGFSGALNPTPQPPGGAAGNPPCSP